MSMSRQQLQIFETTLILSVNWVLVILFCKYSLSVTFILYSEIKVLAIIYRLFLYVQQRYGYYGEK